MDIVIYILAFLVLLMLFFEQFLPDITYSSNQNYEKIGTQYNDKKIIISKINEFIKIIKKNSLFISFSEQRNRWMLFIMYNNEYSILELKITKEDIYYLTITSQDGSISIYSDILIYLKMFIHDILGEIYIYEQLSYDPYFYSIIYCNIESSNIESRLYGLKAYDLANRKYNNYFPRDDYYLFFVNLFTNVIVEHIDIITSNIFINKKYYLVLYLTLKIFSDILNKDFERSLLKINDMYNFKNKLNGLSKMIVLYYFQNFIKEECTHILYKIREKSV